MVVLTFYLVVVAVVANAWFWTPGAWVNLALALFAELCGVAVVAADVYRRAR